MSQMKEIELGIDQAKAIVARKEQVLALFANSLFKEIIEEGYLQNEAIRLVKAKAAPLSPEQERNVDKMIYGIGCLHGYLTDIIVSGQQAESALLEYDEAREQLIADGEDSL